MFDLTPVHVISSKYVPNWGAWEAFREVYCNTLDADPAAFILAFQNNSTADFFTRTAPSWHNLFLLGDGSKGPGGATIGQFGEGLKNAALVAVRLGGNITIKTPVFTAHYELRDIPGAAAPVLYCIPTPPGEGNPKEGCLVTLHVPGANLRSFEDRFIAPNQVCIQRPERETTRIYCKGVFIAELPTVGLYDYNLNNITVNRDRSIPDTPSVQLAFARDAAGHLTDEDIRTLLLGKDRCKFETDALNAQYYYTNTALFDPRVRNVAREEWGDKVCTPGEPSAMRWALDNGYRVVNLERWAQGLLSYKSADAVMPKAKDRRIVADVKPYAAQLRYLRSALRGLPSQCSISIIDNELGDAEPLESGEGIHLFIPRRLFNDPADVLAPLSFCIAAVGRLTGSPSDDANTGASSAAYAAAKMVLGIKKFSPTPQE